MVLSFVLYFSIVFCYIYFIPQWLMTIFFLYTGSAMIDFSISSPNYFFSMFVNLCLEDNNQDEHTSLNRKAYFKLLMNPGLSIKVIIKKIIKLISLND